MLYNQGQFSRLEKATRVLLGPGRTRLNVKGKFTATLRKNSKSTKEEIYVVEGLCTPLLGGLAANNISLDSKETVKREFPKLFCGLGKMEGEYNIVLKPGAQPFCISTPRRISLPHLPKSNGEAERAVRTIKSLLKKSSDPYLALMAYRTAPLANGYSPTELLMGRKIRTPVPVISSKLNPGCADMDNLKRTEQKYREKLRQNHDQRHRARDMPCLQPGDHVWVKDTGERGTVVSTAGTPRSYIVETPGSTDTIFHQPLWLLENLLTYLSQHQRAQFRYTHTLLSHPEHSV
ncbi:hypothetical protein DPEC_G00247790 [Dallia pectoralis]|uniref:Uncharacterized protein n=1 Tax=Dallia pectoralis TaxID=75939 RepID=A0ACC2FWU7_DALPE|nr:hypothetical protein DPEC_G00247790 [Dallia pectoralis]